MILHILGKDFRRLWPWALGLALIQFWGAMGLVVFQEPWGRPVPDSALHHIAHLLGGAYVPHLMNGYPIILHHTLPFLNLQRILASCLIVVLVQLDPIPGTQKDWLVRPVSRRDLLAAKLLFVVLLILGPALGAYFFAYLAGGVPPSQASTQTWAQDFAGFIAVCLPAMAIGAMTRSLGQALGLMLAAFAGALAVAHLALAMASAMGVAEAHDTFAGTIIVVAGAVAILGLQYFRRATHRSFAILAAATALATAMPILL